MIYRFNQFELDTDHRCLLRDGEQVPLSAKGFDLLCQLVTNGGKVLTKDDLLESVWPGQFVEENNLSVQVSALRKLLSDGGSQQYIATISGRGYSFVAPVERGEGDLIVEQRTFERVTIEQEPDEIKMLGGKPRLPWPLIAACLVVIALGGLFAYRYYLNAHPPKINSVAILPFANETADPNNEYLTDGLAESVIYSLSQVPELRVMSRGSVFRYKGTAADAKTIGSELNVNAVLTGRVTQRGDDLKISAELVSAADNAIIWGEQFTRKLSDIEKLQTDISGSIASKLRLKLTGTRPKNTENAEAYRTYLQALYYWNKRTPENIAASIELFQKAIAQDPQFAQAYGGLAMAYEVQGANTAIRNEDLASQFALIDSATDKALEMDENLPEALIVLALKKRRDWDFAGSEASFRRAIERSPSFATAHQWYSELLSNLGRHDEAWTEIERARELDPYSRAIMMNTGLRHLSAGRTDDAIAVFRKLTETDPEYAMSYMFLGSAYEEKGMFLEALEPLCKGDTLLKVDPPELCAKESEDVRAAFKSEGPAGYWRENLKITQRLHKQGVMDDVGLAGAYFHVGDKGTGFQLLEKAYAERHHSLISLRSDPPTKDIVNDPRYQNLLVRIGLMQ